MVILSGGEPLMRDDIFKIARYGTQKGLVMAMGTSGVLIDETCARENPGFRDPQGGDQHRFGKSGRARFLPRPSRRMGAGRAGDPPLRERGDRVQINTTVLYRI